MNKLEYMSALRTALAGLPQEVINDMISAYEMRFIEGATLGRSETEVVQGLDAPEVVAARLRQPAPQPIGSAPQAGPAAKTASSAPRLFFSFVGLSIFNCFMLIPAFVFVMLLFASYVCSMSFMVAGSALTAASMANVNTITLNGARHAMHRHHIRIDDDESAVIRIGNGGVEVSASDSGDKTRTDKDINVSIDDDGRAPSFWKGILLIGAGIFLFLLNLVVSKYSFLGLKRYAIMNYTILKNA